MQLDNTERDKDDFSYNDVISFWNNYLSDLKSKQPILYNALNSTVCKVIENEHLILFEFPSNSVHEEFENLSEYFLPKLKKHLNNYSINIKYEIKESAKTILLTSKDKYYKMVKVNPLIEKLKNDFKLDIF